MATPAAAAAAAAEALSQVPEGMHPAWLTMSRLRRRKHAPAISLANALLAANPRDEAVWWCKVRALTASTYVDAHEVEEDSLADMLLDDAAIAQAPRPGTSLRRPLTSAQAARQGAGSSLRPASQSGRPISGFARPGSQGGGSLASALRTGGAGRAGTAAGGAGIGGTGGARGATGRAVSVAGRMARLGTASLMAATGGGAFVDVNKLNLPSFARKPALGRALMLFLLHHAHAPRRALELAALATEKAGFADWWWKEQLGHAYAALGLLRDAEAQLRSSLKHTQSPTAVLALARIFLRLDQPAAALDLYSKALTSTTGADIVFAVGAARVQERLGLVGPSVARYKQVLTRDPTHVEATACIAAHLYYADQPEMALRLYRRLAQAGVHAPEVWANIALCAFASAHYDVALPCFERALALAAARGEDADAGACVADVWYNVGCVGAQAGDHALAAHAWRVCLAHDARHAEAHNNLGVVELRAGNVDAAKAHFATAAQLAGPGTVEPWWNLAVGAYRAGRYADAHAANAKVLAAEPEHADANALQTELQRLFLAA